MGEKITEAGHEGPEPEKADARKHKMIEQDPNDIPHKESQVQEINPGKVQPGHRDREQV